MLIRALRLQFVDLEHTASVIECEFCSSYNFDRNEMYGIQSQNDINCKLTCSGVLLNNCKSCFLRVLSCSAS